MDENITYLVEVIREKTKILFNQVIFNITDTGIQCSKKKKKINFLLMWMCERQCFVYEYIFYLV